MPDNDYIQTVPVDYFDGAFTGNVIFENGLNIISGENGTAKTTVLSRIYLNSSLLAPNPQGKKVAGEVTVIDISPIRIAGKVDVDHFYATTNRAQDKIKSMLEERKQGRINDSSSVSFPSYTQMIAAHVEDKLKGGDIPAKQAVKEIEEECNIAISKIFTDYRIEVDWQENKCGVSLFKRNTKLTISQTSCGERELISLLLNIFLLRKWVDVYVIDEPEIHLNWSLEYKLFEFLDWLCAEYAKQIIVATHSRIIFREPFRSKTQFFVWEGDKIVSKKDVSQAQIAAIAGEAISIMEALELDAKAFFVEDRMHKKFMETLIRTLKPGSSIPVVPLGNKSNVLNLLKAKRAGIFKADHAYFVVDGDAENPPSELDGDKSLIWLSRRCIENYLLHVPTLAQIFGVSEGVIEQSIIAAFAQRRTTIRAEELHAADGAKVFHDILAQHGMKEDDFFQQFFMQAKSTLQTFLDEKLLAAVKD